MDAPVLITRADPRSLRQTLRQLSGKPFTWSFLGQKVVEFQRAKLAVQGQGAYLDTTSRFHQAAEDLRGSFLTYLYDIGRDLNALRWWLTTLSYRNCYVSSAFQRVCYLKVALDLANSWEGPEPLVMVVADEPVRRDLQQNLSHGRATRVIVLGHRWAFSIRPLKDIINLVVHRTFFVLREGYRVFQSRRMLPRPLRPTQPTTLLISWATLGNIGRGEGFHESFFGDLAARLDELGCHMAVTPIILKELPYKETLRRLREMPVPLLVPHRYLSILDLVRAAVSTCTRPPRQRPMPSFCGMDISSLAEEELRSHWVSNAAADALLIVTLVRRWSALNFPIDRFIYIYENQPPERALCWEVRRSFPEATLVGYQHARAPRLLLNFYLAPGGETEAPLPDRIVTVGKHTARLLSNDGYAPGRIVVGGALQMQGLVNHVASVDQSEAGLTNHTVLVASSDGLEETVELVSMAANMFDENDGIQVVLKCHPRMPYQKVQGLIGAQLPKHVRVSDDPIIDLISDCAVMVYSGSTVAIEAMALGVPTIHLTSQFDFDLDPLEAVPDLRLAAMGLEDLRQKVRWLLEHREEYIAQHQEDWASLVSDMYGPVTEETFRAFVE